MLSFAPCYVIYIPQIVLTIQYDVTGGLRMNEATGIHKDFYIIFQLDKIFMMAVSSVW